MPRISCLPDYDPEEVSLDDYIAVVQNNVTRKITAAAIAESIRPEDLTFNGNPTQILLNGHYVPEYPQVHFINRKPNDKVFIVIFDGFSWHYTDGKLCGP